MFQPLLCIWGNFLFAPGCKTYASSQGGVLEEEMRRVRSRHRAKLPAWQRFLIWFQSRLILVAKHPRKLLTYPLNRIRRLFGAGPKA